jgi:NADH-quinone oxidoreductase subunit N
MNIFLSLSAILPELLLLVGICGVLLVGLFGEEAIPRISYRTSLLVLVFLIWMLHHNLGAELPAAIVAKGNYIHDRLSDLLKLSSVILTLLLFVNTEPYLESREIPRLEYYVMALVSLLGTFVMISAQSLLVVYLGLELVSLPIYALIAIRRDVSIPAEAAMKYFVMGALASGMLLYGISLAYGVTHSLSITAIANPAATIMEGGMLMFSLAVVLIVTGISFKLGAVPFHMWLPDVYEGAPTPVTAYISALPKIAGLAMALRILAFWLGEETLQEIWQPLLIIVAVASVVLGNVVAIAQSNIKRMLAYSTIGHIGFLLIGILAGTAQGYSAAVFYIITYSLVTVCAFSILILLSEAGVEAENIDDLRGLGTRSPWYALIMLFVMFSLAGIPPLVGFYAKFAVLQAAVDSGFVWVAGVALLFSVIGAYYYLRIIKVMYFDAAEVQTPVIATPSVAVALTVNGVAVLLFGIFPSWLFNLCKAVML